MYLTFEDYWLTIVLEEEETLAMKNQLTVSEIIRAWKDKQFHDSLNEEQRAQLPANPAGLVEIDDEQLVQVAGGAWNTYACH